MKNLFLRFGWDGEIDSSLKPGTSSTSLDESETTKPKTRRKIIFLIEKSFLTIWMGC